MEETEQEMRKHRWPIEWRGNEISVAGDVSPEDFRKLSLGLYVLMERQGYKDIRLDFSDCSFVPTSFMLPIVAICHKYQSEGVDIDLIMPNDPGLQGLFNNANWAYYIDPRRNDESHYEGVENVPAIRYKNHDEQHAAVDRAIDAILSSLSAFDRKQLKALEWALNEITDNVLNHAQTPYGGFLQVSLYPSRSHVEFCVADAGISIPKSLRIKNHERALEEAIREGVTRDKETNAGNGLFGSYSIAVHSGGKFQLHSGCASLTASEDGPLSITSSNQYFSGTVVVARVDCSKEGLLDEALRFRGDPHDPPYDYIEQRYESDVDGEMTINLRDEAPSFGSREAGKSVKVKITNLLHMNPNAVLRIDFKDVFIISSSFADEVFGRIFTELGPVGFMKRIHLENIDKTVQNLIDRAITQRVSNTASGGSG